MIVIKKIKNYVHTHEKTEKIYIGFIEFKNRVKAINYKGILKKIIRYPLVFAKSDITPFDARNTLMNFHARPEHCTAISKNEVLDTSCDLQIIIPCYNVERYVDNCIKSVLSQKTNFSFHIILIDDGSTDKTPEILDKYKDLPVVTVHHIQNGGSSAARNTGLKTLFGKYIMFIDGDDFLLEDAIDKLMGPAVQNDYEIVQGGFYAAVDGKLVPYHVCYKNDKLVREDKLMGYPWGKVFKSDLWENFRFPLGLRHQDTVNSFLIFPNSKKTFVISDAVYGYNQNPSGVTKKAKVSSWAIDTYWITEVLDADRQKLGYRNNKNYYEKLLTQFILNYRRTLSLPDDLKESIFVLEAELLKRNFPIMRSFKNFWLAIAFYFKDYNKYSHYFSDFS